MLREGINCSHDKDSVQCRIWTLLTTGDVAYGGRLCLLTRDRAAHVGLVLGLELPLSFQKESYLRIE